MKRAWSLAAPLVLCAPVVAHAQTAPEAAKSAEQITCDLTGDCGDEASAGDMRQDRGEVRGFNVARAPAPARPTLPGGPVKAIRISGATRSAQFAVPTVVPDQSGRRPRLATSNAQASGSGHRKAAAVRPAAIGKSSLAVGFALDSATLDSAGLAQAQALLTALRGPGLAGHAVIVAGHTDSIGSREYNIDLSQRRARAIVDYLASNGVARDLLDPVGYGYDRPLPGLSAGEPRNRRVEIELAATPRR